MPQVSIYLSNDNGLPASDDTPRLDNSKRETWSLLLPSALPKDDRSLCHKGVVETERALRMAQLQDSLEDLRQFRRSLRNLRLYFKTNTAGEGIKTQTKSRTAETGVNSRIKRAVCRYRIAYRALSELDPTGDWRREYHELRDEDNRGPLKEVEERGTGDGRYAPSWIWTSPSAVLPGEGSDAEQREINETVRHEWMTCRARADRWMEEEELLQEEMRRVIIYLEWKSRTWSEKVGVRAGSCTPDIQHGVDAYARKQANIHHGITMSFANQWLPYLKAHGFNTQWATKLPWASQILSRETKLPKKFLVVPVEDGVPPTTDPSPSTAELGMRQKDPDACETRSKEGGSRGKDRCEERSDGGDMACGGGEQGSDDEEQYSDDESEGYRDDDDYNDDDDDNDDDDYDEEGGFDDGTETSDELGFEYDDEYMA